MRARSTDPVVATPCAVDSNHPAFRAVSGLVKETKESTKSALESLVGGKL